MGIEKEISGIYEIINLKNNKRYIGSSRNIKHRWNCHKSELRKNEHENNHLQNAWNLYKEDCFKFQIIKEIEDNEKLLLDEERKEIAKYDWDTELYNENKLIGKPPTLRGENHPKAILNEKQVKELREKYHSNKDISMVDLGEEYKVTPRTIQAVIANRSWKNDEYTPINNQYRNYYAGKNDVLKTTLSQFIDKSKLIHGDAYDYSKVNYINNVTKILIICSIHGEFTQIPSAHTSGKGCKKCGNIKNTTRKRYTFESMVKTAISIHGEGKYEYPIQEIDSRINIKIFCITHQEYFFQRMNSHLQGKGCPKCGNLTKGKNTKNIKKINTDNILSCIIKYISSVSTTAIEFIDECSIIVKNINLIIQLNKLNNKYNKNEIAEKTFEHRKNGLSIFHIYDDEWGQKQNIIKSMISYRMGIISNTISARKTEICLLSKEEGEIFFDTSHISGNTRANIYIGLKYNNCIVAAISFREPIQKNKYGEQTIEIARFANALNTTVNGGFQKLLKYSENYLKSQQFNNILTYADLRFGEGKVYEKAGFTYEGHTNCDYWYTDGIKRYNRFKFRANPEKGLTEAQVAEAAGVHKIYGCGSNIYTKKLL